MESGPVAASGAQSSDLESVADAPARQLELCARLVLCISFAALIYALWTSYLPATAKWNDKLLRVLPRFSIFAAATLFAAMIIGARPRPLVLLFGGLLALGGAFFLQTSGTGGAFQSARLALLTGTVFELIRFELSMLAPLLLGIWLGREIREPRHFIALLLCAAVGDLWMSSFQVGDAVAPGHPLRLLRMPWPQASANLALAPAFTDLLFVAAVLESARLQRFHLPSIAAGALAGYAAAAFLSLGPWPAWTALTMIMCTSGILISCWPDLRCNASEAGKAILLSAVLLAALAGLTSLHFKLNPIRQPTIEIPNYQNVT